MPHLFVGIQFACLLLLASTGPLVPVQSPISLFLGVIGVALGVWALYTMRTSLFSIYPIPKAGSKLVESGPYALIRHPMYTAVFLVAGSWLWAQPSLLRGVVYFILVVNLCAKAWYEEHLLREAFTGYSIYMHRTHRFIPWLI